MTPELIAGIHENYGIRVVSSERVALGVLNHNYKIDLESGVSYFLKTLRPETVARIQTIEFIEGMMNKAGIPVIMPIQNKLGGLHTLIGDTYVTVSPFVSDCIQVSRKDLSTKNIESMAQLHARMHIISAAVDIPDFVHRSNKQLNPVKTLEKLTGYKNQILAKDNCSNEDLLFLDLINCKIEYLENQYVQRLLDILQDDIILVHGDYHEDNVFFDDQGNVAHVFDFELSKVKSRYNDLLKSVHVIFLDSGDTSVECLEKVRHYISKYNEVYPFDSKVMREVADRFFEELFFSTWMEDFYYINGNQRATKFVAGNTNLLKSIATHSLRSGLISELFA